MTKQQLSKGFFISFEGAEGAGKSTQAALLAEYLEKLGYEVRVAIEPGITDVGKIVRAFIKDRANVTLSNEAEALLLAAARAQNIHEIYQPLLEKNGILIADRYVDSSYAYQGYGRGLGYEPVKAINDFAINGLLPNLTILLDLDYKEALQRRHETGKVDRMDLQDDGFHQRVHEAYQELALKFPQRIVVVDGSKDIDTVFGMVQDEVIKALGLKVPAKTVV